MEQKGTPKKKVQARSHYTEEQIAKVLVATDGFICATAQTLKINRRSVYKYLKRYPALEDVLADARENSLDIAESRLMKAIRADNLTAIIFFLKAHVSDVSVLDDLVPEPGACYVMDRGYIHFARLYRLTLSAAFFVVRARKNMQYRRRYSHRVDKTTGLRSDQTIVLTGHDSAHDYPAPARLIRYWDEQQNLRLRFLTNNFLLPALTIAQLYKRRWDVELFFKWIKQHLRIKKFYGTSANAVKTQIWVAVIVYLMVAILKKQLGIEASLYRILQILSVTVFEKTPILQVLEGLDSQLPLPRSSNQLTLFDL